MRVINNTSNVTANFGGNPLNFISNNVQTIINSDPIFIEDNPQICYFYDFDRRCYFNPCDIVWYNDCEIKKCLNICKKIDNNVCIGYF